MLAGEFQSYQALLLVNSPAGKTGRPENFKNLTESGLLFYDYSNLKLAECENKRKSGQLFLIVGVITKVVMAFSRRNAGWHKKQYFI